MSHPRITAARHGQRYSVLALCLASLAQGALANEQSSETILVIGQAARIKSALDAQQQADSIVSVVHADGIGALPDTNAAEALQRVPGVSVERDQGEGRYIRVRGLGPDLNSVTVNGSLLPSPESERRAVMLDVIPAGLIRALEVHKTLLPEQDANSLGGTVEVKTLSAFDQPGELTTLEAEAGRDQNTGQTSPKLAGSWANRFADGRLGLAAGLSWEKRKFGSDNVETGGKWEEEDGAARLAEFERRDYLITRERLGAAFNLDFKPQAGSHFFARSLVSRYSDSEVRQAHLIEFADAQAEGVAGDAEAKRELKDREETQQLRSLVLGTGQQLGVWKLDALIGLGYASEKEPQHIAGASFKGEDDFSAVGFRNGRQPALFGPASLNEASQYSLDEVELAQTRSTDRERNLRLDLARSFSLGEADLRVKFGAKTSRRDKRSDAEVWLYEDLGDAGFSDAQLNLRAFSAGRVDYALGDFGPALSGSAIRQLLGGLAAADYRDEEESRVNDFEIREDIRAAYLQGTLSQGDSRLLAGVRYEGTRLRASGTGLENGDFVASQQQHDYHQWLPALHLRHDLSEATSLRAAWTQAVVRPTFGQLAPGFVIDDSEASFGNPQLKPLRARNLDLGIEQRLGRAGSVSAYLFHKRIKDFIYQTDLAGSGDWADFDEAISFANGDAARVRGLELSFTQHFQNGLLLASNATLSRSKAQIAQRDADSGQLRARQISLPSQSDRTLNLSIGYEKGPLSLRLAGNYKSAYLLEVGDVLDADQDLQVAAQTQYDFSAHWQLSKRTQLSFEALNLRDEPYYVYAGRAERNAQYEQYGRSYKLGLKFALY